MWKQKRMYGKRLGRYSSWQHLRYSPSPETPALTDPIPATSNLPINSDIYIYIYIRGSLCSQDSRVSEKNLCRENDEFYYAVDPSEFFRFLSVLYSLCSLATFARVYFERVSRDIISRKFRNLSFRRFFESSGRFN